jgi:predicted kinase
MSASDAPLASAPSTGHRRLVVMSGLPGSGKTRIAEGVAGRLGLPVLSVDPIESAMISAGLEKSFETGLAAYLVARDVAAQHLRRGHGVVVDAVSAEEVAKGLWRQLAAEFGQPLTIIEMCLADRAEHRRRIEFRREGLVGIPKVSWHDVEARRSAYSAWTEPLLRLDSSHPVERNVQLALEHVRSTPRGTRP